MNKLSTRLGLLFFVFMILIESILFFFLYSGMVSERIESETTNLLARGTNHRDVLEKKFDLTTTKHVALMESGADTAVVITDSKFNVIQSSIEVNQAMHGVILQSKTMTLSHHGRLLEEKWKTENYLATVNPIIIDNKLEGYVYMFLDTIPIRNMINNLTQQFLLIGMLSLFIMLITIFILSRFIVAPLIEMKKVTEHISSGNHDYRLNTRRDDELGDLARAIQSLSNHIERLKNDRNEFLSSISHELRTPLTYLKGYADVATRPNLPDNERNEYLAIIKEEASNVAALISDLFELAKMDENQFLIKKETIHFKQYLERIKIQFQQAFLEKNIQLEIYCDSDVKVFLDTERFKQVFNNLLDNALKHSQSHTKVTIAVNQTEIGQLTAINVSDQGEGIPEEDLPFIWDRLYRVEKSRSRLTGGSGLGLAIVKKIVEGHGGEITVKSKKNVGTIFTIQLKGV